MKVECNRYRFFSKATDLVVADGTAEECAKQLGITEARVRNIVVTDSAKYRVESYAPEKLFTHEVQELVTQWDDYTKKFTQWLDGGCKRSNFPFEV